jgi:hypothetical protein
MESFGEPSALGRTRVRTLLPFRRRVRLTEDQLEPMRAKPRRGSLLRFWIAGWAVVVMGSVAYVRDWLPSHGGRSVSDTVEAARDPLERAGGAVLQGPVEVVAAAAPRDLSTLKPGRSASATLTKEQRLSVAAHNARPNSSRRIGAGYTADGLAVGDAVFKKPTAYDSQPDEASTAQRNGAGSAEPKDLAARRNDASELDADE